MKKFLLKISSFLGTLLLLLAPITASASLPEGVAAYTQNGLAGEEIYTIKGEVCKIVNCLTAGSASDWYNYTATSETLPGDNGAVQTLVVAPGDTLTFKGTVSYTAAENSIRYPVYKVSGTNLGYLEDFDYFGTGKDDVDNDGNHFLYDPINETFELETGLVYDGSAHPQVGAVSARVKADTPVGSVISVNFFINDENDPPPTFNPFGSAYAADTFARSGVRLQVTTAPTVLTLPRTGVDKPTNYSALIAGVLGTISLLTFGVYFGRKKRVKVKK